MPDFAEIFSAVRRPDDQGDHDPVGPIRITTADDVPGAVAKAQRRKRRAPPYAPETLAAFDPSAPEVRE